MSSKLRMGKTRTLAASLVIVAAAIFGTAASAQYGPPTSAPCYQAMEADCAANYLTWGYRTYADCTQHLWCYYCMGGYLCGIDPRLLYTANEPDIGKPLSG